MIDYDELGREGGEPLMWNWKSVSKISMKRGRWDLTLMLWWWNCVMKMFAPTPPQPDGVFMDDESLGRGERAASPWDGSAVPPCVG